MRKALWLMAISMVIAWSAPSGAINVARGGKGTRVIIGVNTAQHRRKLLEELADKLLEAKADQEIDFEEISLDGDSVRLRIPDPEKRVKALSLIDGKAADGELRYGVSQRGRGLLLIQISQRYLRRDANGLIDDSLNVIRARAERFVKARVSVKLLSGLRIELDLPKILGPSSIKNLLGTPPKLTFQIVDENVSSNDRRDGNIPANVEALPEDASAPGADGSPILVYKDVLLTGDQVKSVSNGFDEDTKQPVIYIRFDAYGASKLQAISRDNVGRRMAIILNRRVIYTPVITEPIEGDSVQLRSQDSQPAVLDLALRLASAAQPSPLELLDVDVVRLSTEQ